MKDIKFMTANSYIYLPSKQNPKVALAVDNGKISENSFELYNPFSKKAIFLKKVALFFSVKFNFVINFFSVKVKKPSSFIDFLEKKLNRKIITSVYYATAKDKIVLQLQSLSGEILGYLKYPINNQGYENIRREIEAYEELSKLYIVKKYIFKDVYDNRPFIFLPKLEGEIKELEDKDVSKLLISFHKKDRFLLSEHPRISDMKQELIKYKLNTYLETLVKLIEKSKVEYLVCFEHGDFTPWNIVKQEDGFVPFDFEYFVKNGIEYFDLIKYYYQVGTLLKHYNGHELIGYILSKLNIPEKFIIFKIYLIKEILIKTKEGQNYNFEEELLVKLEMK